MTFVGEWTAYKTYKRGDIVFVNKYEYKNGKSNVIGYEYYICTIEHESCNLVFPKNPEEIYWTKIDSDFLTDLSIGSYIKEFLDSQFTQTLQNTQNTQSNLQPSTPQAPTEPNFPMPPPGAPLLPFLTIPNQLPCRLTSETVEVSSSGTLTTSPIPSFVTYPNNINVTTQNTLLTNVGDGRGAPQLLSEEELRLKNQKNKIKRKITNIEKELEEYKKRRRVNNKLNLSMEERLLLLNTDMETKIFLLEKYENIQKSCGSDYSKGKTWLKTVLNLPFKKYKPFPIKVNDDVKDINDFFENVKNKLDANIHGLEYVKEEILEFLARKITNPQSKGHVLALQGSAGVGKTKILKSLAEALELPFYQINCGGLNDVSVLTGHSETYVGAKPGKFVEILENAGCMNPILYLDEIDKISDHKGKEINGVLTHILDEEQNDKFQDNYLSNINIDMSKVFFVVAFNDISKVDPIVLDRMKIIQIKNPSIDDKIIIARDKMIPELCKSFKRDIFIDDSDIEYIINNKIPNEDGVRQMKKTLEKLFNKLNYQILIGKFTENKITRKFIDESLENHSDDTSYQHMYI
jgi:hypothetical protein